MIVLRLDSKDYITPFDPEKSMYRSSMLSMKSWKILGQGDWRKPNPVLLAKLESYPPVLPNEFLE